MFDGGGWWINPGAGNKHFAYAGLGVTRQITEQFKLGAELFHQTPSIAGGMPATGITIGGV